MATGTAGGGWRVLAAAVALSAGRGLADPGATVVAEPLPAATASSTAPVTAVGPAVSGTALAVPVLTGGWTLPPPGGCSGLPFPVTLTVSNTGTAPASGLTCRLRVEGSAGATVLEAPPVPEVIPAGGVVALRWLLTAASGGTVAIRARVRAHDGSGTVVADSGRIAAPEFPLVAPGAVAAAVATRAEASVGQWIAIAVTVSNTGGVPIDHVAAFLSGPEGSGRFRTSPPPVPNLSLEPGSSLRLLWTWSVSAPGPLPFSASVYADTCGGVLAVSASASVTPLCVPPALLTGAIAVSASRLVSGQKIEVALTLSNTGGAGAANVMVPLPTPATSRAKLVSGPMRVQLPLLAPGSSTRLVWQWTMEGKGPTWFTGRVTAHDANADWAIGTGLLDSPRLRLLAPAWVKADQFTLFPEPIVRVGGYVTASLVLTNTGETPAALTSLDIKEMSNPGGLLFQRSLVSPSLPMEIPSGDSRSVVWTYRTGALGTAKLEAKAKLVEAATGNKLADVKAVSNQIAATGFISP